MARATSTKAVDADVEYFFYSVDLTIDPPLDDTSAAKFGTNEFLTLKQVKDEDVKLVDGEIVVVSTNVTSVKAGHKSADQVYGYSELKKAASILAAIIDKTDSTIAGHIIVRRGDGDSAVGAAPWRLRLNDKIAVVEPAALGWPDGTQSPWPA